MKSLGAAVSKIKIFEKLKKKILIEKHPLIAVDTYIKYSYFTGLVLIADCISCENAEAENWSYNKMVLLENIAISLDLPDELHLKAKNIGKNPDEYVIKDIVESLDGRLIQFLFLLDAKLLLKKICKIMNKEAEQIVKSFAQMLRFDEKEKKLLEDLKASVLNKNYDHFTQCMSMVVNEKEANHLIIKSYLFDDFKYFPPENEAPLNETHIALNNPAINIEAPKKQKAKCERIDLGGGIILEMIYIKPGTFIMGDNNGGEDEKPSHKVKLNNGYWLGKYPVTQQQWEVIMKDNPSYFKNCKNNPVEGVSWRDCQNFITKLNKLKLVNGTFRLPTEAEWEYASRGGTKTNFHWGDDPSCKQIGRFAWYKQNSDSKTHPVGKKQPNGFELYDMFGNVLEWCGDWYGGYEGSRMVDPVGPARGSYRVIRGGSWCYDAILCRSGCRFFLRPSERYGNVGMRLVMVKER